MGSATKGKSWVGGEMAMQGRSRSAEQVRDKSGLEPHEIACVGVLNYGATLCGIIPTPFCVLLRAERFC